jgi:YVTN family beta-propeller protein
MLGADARGAARAVATSPACEPEWVEPGRALRTRVLYVSCRRSHEIVEIDSHTWRVLRRFATGAAPGTIMSDAAGTTLFATLRADSAIAVIDLATGLVRERISTSQASPHGLAVTSDGAYLFVTNEGAGTAKGSVDVIDVRTLRRVATAPLGYAPGGIGILSH